MSNFIKVYQDAIKKINYSSDLCYCDHCGEEIKTNIFIIYSWSKKKSDEFKFCSVKCRMKAPIFGSVIEEKIAVVVSEIPFNAVPVPPVKPALTNSSNMDNFSAALKNIADEETTDRTVYAGRESWEGPSIGKVDYKALEEKDKPATDIEIFQILNATPEAKPALESKEDKKRLEAKRWYYSDEDDQEKRSQGQRAPRS